MTHRKSTKLQQGFHRICNSLDSYSGIFALFPSDNEYVTVLCGSLKLIVASSVRHMETAELFVKSFGEALGYIEVVMIYGGLMDLEPMRRLISKLYGKVFEFLRFAMIWWASNSLSKTVKALGKGFHEDLQKKTREIEVICKEIDSQAHARGCAESRYIRIVGDETNGIVRDLVRRDSHLHKLSDSNMRLSRDNQALHRRNEILHERLLQKQRDYDEALRKKKMEIDYEALSTQMIRSLEDIFRMRAIDQSNVGEIVTQRVRELTPGAEDQLRTYGDDLARTDGQVDQDNPHVLLRDDALSVAQSLDSYIIGRRVIEDRGLKNANSSAVVLSRLHRWSKESSSQCLWVIGKPDHTLPSNMCKAASAMITTARRLDIKLISHFGELPSHRDRREEAGLISLVYSLIIQLLELMPPMINADDVPLNLGRLSKLDGTMDTWYEGLDLLEDLLQHNPWPLLLCVIDGLTRLDFGSGTPRCEELIDLLLKHLETSDKVFKILLTSSGNTGKNTGLGRQIPIDNRVYANESDELPLDLAKSLSESRETSVEPPGDLERSKT